MQKKRLNVLKKISITITLLLVVVAIGFFLLKKYYPKFYSFGDNTYSSKYYVHGVDLSHHNPIVDWSSAPDHNISFAYLKVTEGSTHQDRNYKYNYKAAKKNNVTVGAYHFYRFGVSGQQQAKHFIKNAKCASGDLIPAIDVEHSPHNMYTTDTAKFKSIVKELKVLEKELYEHYGFRPIIYTNKECYKLYVKKYFPDNPIWICDLHKEPTDKEVKNWIFWQFSHKGKLDGVDGDIDLNYFRYSFDEMKKYLLP